MNTKTILLSVITGSTCCGVAVTGFYYLFNNEKQPKNIKEYLAKEELQLLNTDVNQTTDDATWKNLIKKHVATAQPVESSKKIKGLVLKTQNAQDPIINDIKALKEKCKSLLSKPVSKGKDFETDLQNVRDWCNGKSDFAKV